VSCGEGARGGEATERSEISPRSKSAELSRELSLIGDSNHAAIFLGNHFAAKSTEGCVPVSETHFADEAISVHRQLQR